MRPMTCVSSADYKVKVAWLLHKCSSGLPTHLLTGGLMHYATGQSSSFSAVSCMQLCTAVRLMQVAPSCTLHLDMQQCCCLLP